MLIYQSINRILEHLVKKEIDIHHIFCFPILHIIVISNILTWAGSDFAHSYR